MAERRERLAAGRTSAFLTQMKRLDLAVDQASDEDAILSQARRHRLTIYDTSCLELAIRAAVPLATLDGKLSAVAQAEGIPLIA